ncbi:MAG: Spy/CpxP family protein refolding chaperone [Pseudomonadota bacterium]|nr:Spy/CpxP family protein refolding chaperone [Pseudomonadota bacterium]
MFSFKYPSIAAIALLAGMGLANAQMAQEHEAHHPDASASAPATPPGAPAGMSKMTGGSMEQMMPMMRMMHGMMGAGGGEMRMMPSEHVEGRIAFLKAELGITEAQLPQWDAFADALRGSAKTMRTAMMGTMQAGMPTTAPAKIDTMVAMMTVRLDALKMTAAAEKSLYAVLTDAQKKTADELMMSPMGVM